MHGFCSESAKRKQCEKNRQHCNANKTAPNDMSSEENQKEDPEANKWERPKEEEAKLKNKKKVRLRTKHL